MGQLMHIDGSVNGSFGEPLSLFFLSHYHKNLININIQYLVSLHYCSIHKQLETT